MWGTYVYIFFEGEGKEAVALEFKDFLEGLLGEPAGVGRLLDPPWRDPEAKGRTRTELSPGDPGYDGPWSYARSVFSFPVYEEHFRSLEAQDPPEENLGEGLSWEGTSPFSGGGTPEAGACEEEDESLYLFGAEMPPEWREGPLMLCFRPFALPAGTEEEQRASRPKARKILRWLRRKCRRSPVEVHLSASFEGPEHFDLGELTAARLLAMAAELQEPEEAEPPPGCLDAALDLKLEMDDPELDWLEPRDRPSWPPRSWRREV